MKHRFLAAAIVCLVLLAWGFWPRPAIRRAIFLSVGQGDCTVIQSGEAAILIDAGPKRARDDAGERLVVPKLRKYGINRVERIILTHPDGDHVGGTGAVLSRYPAAKLVASAGFEGNDQMVAWIQSWKAQPKDIQWLSSGAFGFGGLRFDVWCPPVSAATPDNDGSVCARVSGHGGSLVLTGDLSGDREGDLIAATGWHADILKVGHHGSKSSSSSHFLAAIQPRAGIISCGRENSYRHPHPETLQRLQDAGIRTFRTDTDGDLIYDFDTGRLTKGD